MSGNPIYERAKAALTAADFEVRDDDTGFASGLPEPGGACLFIQDGQVRLYLVTKDSRSHLSSAADTAAEALAGAGLCAVEVGTEPATLSDETDLSRLTSDVLLGGTGELADADDRNKHSGPPRQPIVSRTAVHRAASW